MINPKWYAVCSRKDDFVDADPIWRKQLTKEICCPECKQQRREYIGKPVDAYFVEKPPNIPLASLAPLPIEIAHREFIKLFTDVTKGYFAYGKVFGPNHIEYSEYVTFTVPYVLPIRGGPKSLQRLCSTCGSFTYCPEPFDDKQLYLVSSSLRGAQELYWGDFHYLIINENMLARINFKIRKKLRIIEMNVKDRAEDGIEEFPTIHM